MRETANKRAVEGKNIWKHQRKQDIRKSNKQMCQISEVEEWGSNES